MKEMKLLVIVGFLILDFIVNELVVLVLGLGTLANFILMLGLFSA